LISGQSSSLGVEGLRFLLGTAAQIYSAVIWLSNFLHSKGWLKTYHANAVVISIGNITTGGTGKTPLVIWLCNKITQNSKFKTQNCRCVILTRGYKTTKNLKLKTQNYIDEPAVLKKSCPETEVIVNPDRVVGAAEAVDKFSAEVLIMDDGFQHRRLARDADIVTIDGLRPFGYGKMLPAGLLREPVTALKRVDAVVITRCDQITGAELTRIEEKLHSVNPDMLIAKSFHAPVCAKSQGGKEISIEELKSKKIFAFCGLGNPDTFLNTVKGLGAELVGSKIYNDHHHYTEKDITDIYKQAESSKADLILTTQKDWFATQYAIRNTQYEILFAYLAIKLKFLAGEDKLRGLIENALAGKIRKKAED